MTILAATHVAATQDAVTLHAGRYVARISAASDVFEQAHRLRSAAFACKGRSDQDEFDPESLHGIVTDTQTGTAKVAFRVRVLSDGVDLNATYTGQNYDLAPLRTLRGPYVELGRVCQNGLHPDPMALRMTWAALTALVDQHDASVLIGCTSFPGADIDRHAGALSRLAAHHLGASALRPRRNSPHAVDLPRTGTTGQIPHPLQSYLTLGGWVSDHAVVDPALDTVHVFTGLCIADIPETRKRRLRAIAESTRTPT